MGTPLQENCDLSIDDYLWIWICR